MKIKNIRPYSVYVFLNVYWSLLYIIPVVLLVSVVNLAT